MTKIYFFLLTAIMVLVMASPSFSADSVKPLIIIDVRTEAEWNEGHIEGAILIPYEVIGEKIGAVTKDKSSRTYVYCRSGRRSQIAKKSLEKLGYKDVVNIGSLEEAAKKMKRRIVR
jgi:phage shock protein E